MRVEPGCFQIIYADPAWPYRDKTPRGGAENHYRTMTLDQICALPVSKLAAPDAALFLWVTWPLLFDAQRVIDAWDFEYKNAAFVWCKVNRVSPTPFVGLGHWSRGNTEPCLLAVRGDIRRLSAAVQQVILGDADPQELLCAPIGRHSAKPPQTRDRIVELVGDVPRIELFARDRAPGWHTWGNQLPPIAAALAP